MNKGLIIVISAPSGGGKGTIIKELFKKNDNLRFSVSATTRKPRPGEVDGEQYFFIDKNEFQIQISSKKMIEYAEYCNNFYGTPRDPVFEKIDNGFDVILEIEAQGGDQIRKDVPDSVSIFILPPSMEILEKRLRNRGTEDETTISKRLIIAKSELPQAAKYDYIVINDSVEKAANEIISIITAEKLKCFRNKATIERMIQ